jgi:List-Bact-rpt repeat protein
VVSARVSGLSVAALVAVAVALAVGSATASATFYAPATPPSLCSGPGTAAGQCDGSTNGIKGVAVDSVTHDVFVVDPTNARISQFSSSGTFIRAFGSGVADGTTAAAQVCTAICFKGVNAGAGAIGTAARGIAVDPSTHIVYVASGAARAAYFDGTTGTFLGEFTGPTTSPAAPAAFSNLSGIAVDTSGAQHYIYLATGSGVNSVVDKFTAPVGATPPGYVCQITGKAVASATECHGTASQDGVNNGLDFTGVKGGTLAVDSTGKLYIAQAATRNVVSRYDTTGGFVSQFTVPGAVAVAAGAAGRVFVSTDGTATVGGTHVREYDPAAPSLILSDFGTGTIGGSFGLAVDLGSGPSGGHVYVSDMPNGKVWNYAASTAQTLTVTKTGAGTGSVTSSPPGIACGATCAADFGEGSTVVLSAVSTPDSAFTGWSGACTGTGACSVTMDAAKSVTANFGPGKTLSVTKTGAGAGSVTSSPPGIACGATCAAGYNEGAVVTLTAAAPSGSRFAGWSGACGGTGTCVVTMDAAKSVTASFVPAKTLTVAKSGTGAGTVSSDPVGVDCGPTCAVGYDEGTVVTLTAVASSGSRFTGWSGACTGSGACSVTMDAAKSVTADFIALRHLAVATSGPGSGSVTSAPFGLDCGLTCVADFDDRSSVLLTATAASGSIFTGWSGDCSGDGRCAVTMDAAKSATANFILAKSLTVTKAGPGAGSVDSAPNGISCGAVCAAGYAPGTQVVLMATPAANGQFVGWSGACSGTQACHVTMDEARTVTATFVERAPVVTTTAGARGVTRTSATVRGTVNPKGNAVTNCRIEYGVSRAYGSRVPCSPASPGTGTTPVGVSGALSGLRAATTYYFRIVAANTGGTARGEYMSFTTAMAPAVAGRLTVASRAVVSRGKARLELACAGAATARCAGKLTLKRKRHRVGTATVKLTGGRTKVLAVDVSSKARSLLKRHDIRVKVKGAGLSKTVTLERKR